jgi:hypothetical protein
MKNSKTLLYGLALAASIALAPQSFAQTANSTSGAASSSTAGSQSGSNSGAAAILTINNVPANTTSNNTLNDRVSGGTNNTLTTTDRSTSDVTLRTTPTVYAPPVSGGNPCTLAVSGGVSVIGWGAAAGGTFVDQDCANRQKIAMIHNAGYQQAARELMCNDRDTYMAFKGTQTPCAWRAQYEPKEAVQPPMVQAPPQPVAPPPPAVVQRKEYPRCDQRRGIVDNCRS